MPLYFESTAQSLIPSSDREISTHDLCIGKGETYLVRDIPRLHNASYLTLRYNFVTRVSYAPEGTEADGDLDAFKLKLLMFLIKNTRGHYHITDGTEPGVGVISLVLLGTQDQEVFREQYDDRLLWVEDTEAAEINKRTLRYWKKTDRKLDIDLYPYTSPGM